MDAPPPPPPPQHANSLCSGFLQNIVPASLIWSRGHQALDWSIHSKEVGSSGDNIFRRARLVSGCQQTEDLELSSLGTTWTQIKVTGFAILGGSTTEEQGRCHCCPSSLQVETGARIGAHLTSPFSGGSPLPKVLVTTRTRVSCSRCTMSYSSMDIT